MGSVSAKEMEIKPEYKVDPLLGFENGRKVRGILFFNNHQSVNNGGNFMLVT